MKKIKLKLIYAMLFVASSGLYACNHSTVKTNKNQTDSTMTTTERFDFEEWKRREENGTTDYTKEDGTKVTISGGRNPNISEILPPPSFLKWQRFYHKNGNLRMSGFILGGPLKVGIWRTYDDRGNLIQEEDEDKKFGKIKPEDILLFLDKEGYINVKTGEGRFDPDGRTTFRLGFVPAKTSTLVGEDQTTPLWYITIYAYPYNAYLQTKYIIDGNTGEVLEKKSETILPIE